MLKKAFILSSGNIVNTVISGLFAIYVTRVLGPENKGILAITLSSCDLMSMLFIFGIPYSAAYFVRSHPGSESIVKSLANKAMIICGLLSLCLILLSKKFFSSVFLSGWAIDPAMVTLLIFTIIVNAGNSIIGSAIVAQGDSKGFVISTNIGTITTIICTGILITILPQKLHSVIMGSLIGNLVATIIMRKRYRLSDHHKDAPSTLTTRQFYTFGIQAQGGAVASLVFKRMDLYFISHFLNTTAVGFYSVGLGLRDLAMAGARALADLSGGEMADPRKQADGTAKKVFRKGIVFIVVLSLVIFLVAVFLFPYVIPLAYGKSFSSSIVPSIIIMGSLLPFSIALFVGKAIHAKGKPLNLSISNVISAVISSVVVWLFTKHFGITGAAVATVVNNTILLITGLIFLCISCKWNSAGGKDCVL